jgi:hypothetical protein
MLDDRQYRMFVTWIAVGGIENRDGLAQVLARELAPLSGVRCRCATVVRERPGKGKTDAKGER